MRKYYPIEGNDLCNALEVSVEYVKGGYSYICRREEKRGYYIHIYPVKLTQHETYSVTESPDYDYPVFRFLHEEVKRSSRKAETKAFQYMNDNFEMLIKRMYPSLTISSTEMGVYTNESRVG